MFKKMARSILVVTLLLSVFVLSMQSDAFANSSDTDPSSETAQRDAYSKVALVIVDDFTGAEVSPSRATYDDGDTCVINLEGQGYAVRGASGTSLEGVPHGTIILSQVEELVKNAGLSEKIQIVRVDLASVNSDEVIASIQAEIAKLTDIDFFVVNMSFVMIPCENVQEIVDIGTSLRASRDDQTYRATYDQARAVFETDVRTSLDAEYSISAETMTSSAAEATVYSNPVLEYVATAGAQTIFIASAGNFGLDYSFLPGAYPQVVSVSASNGFGYESSAPWNASNDSPLLSLNSFSRASAATRVSNYGEVMLPGEYAHPEHGTIIGTSFAAPRLSVAVASYLATVGNTYCQTDGHFGLAYGSYDNLTLSEVISQHCANMAASVPAK